MKKPEKYITPLSEVIQFKVGSLLVSVSKTTGGTSDDTDIGDGGDDDGTPIPAAKRFIWHDSENADGGDTDNNLWD